MSNFMFILPFHERQKLQRLMAMKCFQNPYDDFCKESSKHILSNDQLKQDSKLMKDCKSFWNRAILLYQRLDHSDYTVFTGTTGIALLFLRKSDEDPALLNEAVKYLFLSKLKNRRITFLCGDAGPLAVGAAIYYKLQKKVECDQLVQRLIALSTDVLNIKADLPNELLYGRVGYLYALLFVNAKINPPPVDEKLIKKIIGVILQIGKNVAKETGKKVPLMYQWHGKFYLGAAHGLSGILYILLQAHKYLSKSEMNDLIRPTIDYLCNMKYPSGNYMSSLESDTDRLVQWCHGSPGFTHLFCKAYELFKEDKYLNLAMECGDIVWNRGLLRKGYSMCHGVSGNAYTFLQLYQTTRNPKYLYRAAKFAEWCIDLKSCHEEHPADHPMSLFEGVSGRLYFLEDLKDPLNAKFPGYTV